MLPSRLWRPGRIRGGIRFGFAICLLTLGAPAASAATDLLEFHRSASWSVLGSSVGSGGLEIADLDGDGTLEILTGSELGDCCSTDEAHWYVLRYDGEFHQVWTSFVPEEPVLLVRPVARNEGYEIAELSISRMAVYDPWELEPRRSFPLSTSGGTDFVVGDLAGDGNLQLAVCDSDDLWIYDYDSGAQIAVKYGFGCSHLEAGQTDGDPALELALAGNPVGGFVLDGATLDVEWARPEGFGSWARFGNFDTDPRDEIVAIEPIEGRARAWDLETGTMLW